MGFLPKSKKNRDELLEKISKRNETLIFYESPHRILKTLDELEKILGDRNIAVARELTKIHEEFLRGKISEVKNFLTEPKGEFVLIVEGDNDEKIIEPLVENFVDVYKNFIAKGIDKKNAIRETAKKFNVSRREIYNKIVESENSLEGF